MSDKGLTVKDQPKIDIDVLLKRRKVIEELRSGKHKQAFGCVGAWWRPDAAVCWAGLAARTLYNDICIQRKYAYHNPDLYLALSIDMKLDADQFIRLNDAEVTFSELADAMEKLTPPTIPT